MSTRSNGNVRTTERAILAIGLLFLAVWIVAKLHQVLGYNLAMQRFQTNVETNPPNTPALPNLASGAQIDFRLWSPQRISGYKESLTKTVGNAIAILQIPKIHLRVPVFNDADEFSLNRGVGRIPGTAQIGRPGNLAIAGHRDGFFRGLQDIRPGDIIELSRPGGTDIYAVRQIKIVAPEDTYVLSTTAVPTLTLVTCFPFYFIGHAPKRFIVTAQLEATRLQTVRQANLGADDGSVPNAKNHGE
jgi:sortase A